MIIGTSMDQEICLIFGQVSLNLLYWKRNLQTDICGPGRDWRENSLHPGQIIYGQNSGEEWQGMLSWKRKWSIEKPKLDNARRLRGIYFIDPEDKELKETIRNAQKKLETSVAPAMLCKTCKKSKHGETCGKTDDFKSKFACILEASESTKMRMEESLPNHHEDHIARKGDNALQHYNLVHKFIPVLQAMKIQQNLNKTCVYSGSWWIHQNAYGKLDTIKSRRPYCRKRWKFITALQFGAQIYSYASSYENSSSKSCGG